MTLLIHDFPLCFLHYLPIAITFLCALLMCLPACSRCLYRRMSIKMSVHLYVTPWYFLMISLVQWYSRTHRWRSRHSSCLSSRKGMGRRSQKACQSEPRFCPCASYLAISYRKMQFNLRAHRGTICASTHPYPSASNPIQEPETMDGLWLHWWRDTSRVLDTAKFVDEIPHCMHHSQLPWSTSTTVRWHAWTNRWLHRRRTCVRWRRIWPVSITHTVPELVRNGGDVWVAKIFCSSEEPWSKWRNICSTYRWTKVETSLCSRGFEHGKYTVVEGQRALDYRLAREWLFPTLVWWSSFGLFCKHPSLMAIFHPIHHGSYQDLYKLSEQFLHWRS